MERKKPIKKNHIKEFGGRDALEASQGQTRHVPGTPGTFGPDLCVNQNYWDRMSPGQTGHTTGQMGRVPGTDGTHTRGCPAKILYVYWFFFFPKWRASSGDGTPKLQISVPCRRQTCPDYRMRGSPRTSENLREVHWQ